MSNATTLTLSSANSLLAYHTSLLSRVRSEQQSYRRGIHYLQSSPEFQDAQELQELASLPLVSPLSRAPSPSSPSPSSPPLPTRTQSTSPAPSNVHPETQAQSWPADRAAERPDLPPSKRARLARYRNYVPEEETIRNDYSQRYVDSGEWPQNWVLGAEPERRFEEYPKQQRLLSLKKTSVNSYALPPQYLPHSELHTLHPCKFDVILIDPPFSSSFTWDHMQELPVPNLAADPSFVFMWVGSGAGEGLERGREVLAKWGYRRCEDVVWVKTNKTTNLGPGTDPPTTSLFTRTKQHCLIGIRGTVRRSTDSWFVHCNVDTDVIIWEGDPSDPTCKPPETYTLIENFCLGLRRLEIFGRPSSIRRGWVTVLGPGRLDSDPTLVSAEGVRAIRWEKESWEEGIKELSNSNPAVVGTGNVGGSGKPIVPMTPEIDALRPKSPVRPGQHMQQGGAQSSLSVPPGSGVVGPGIGIGVGGMGGMGVVPPGVMAGGAGPMGVPMGSMTIGNPMMGVNNMSNRMGHQMMQPMLPLGMQGMQQMPIAMGGVVDEMSMNMMGGWNPMMTGLPNPMNGMNMGNMGMMGNMGVPNGFGFNGLGGWGGDQFGGGVEAGGWDVNENGMMGMMGMAPGMGGMQGNMAGMGGMGGQWGHEGFDGFQ